MSDKNIFVTEDRLGEFEGTTYTAGEGIIISEDNVISSTMERAVYICETAGDDPIKVIDTGNLIFKDWYNGSIKSNGIEFNVMFKYANTSTEPLKVRLMYNGSNQWESELCYKGFPINVGDADTSFTIKKNRIYSIKTGTLRAHINTAPFGQLIVLRDSTITEYHPYFFYDLGGFCDFVARADRSTTQLMARGDFYYNNSYHSPNYAMFRTMPYKDPDTSALMIEQFKLSSTGHGIAPTKTITREVLVGA